MATPQELDNMKKRIIDGLQYYASQQVYRILFRGRPVKVRSGKSAWTTAGAAKSALKCHIDNGYYAGSRDDARAVLEDMLREKEITIERI